MTTAKILAVGVVLSIMLVAAGASFRDARQESPQSSPRTQDELTRDNFDARWMSSRKGDRLPMRASLPLAVASAQPEASPPVASPPEQLQLATDDDLRQAAAEHHHHHDICSRGRSWFSIGHHRYWRCR